MKHFKMLFLILSALCVFIPAVLSAQMDWTSVTDSAGWSPRAGNAVVVFDNKMWVMGGWGLTTNLNDVWYSTDGLTWICAQDSAPWAARAFHSLVVFHDTMWLIGGDNEVTPPPILFGDVWKSGDGVNWTCAQDSAPWIARAGHTSVVYNDKMWVMGGFSITGGNGVYLNDVWSSYDGVNWTCDTSSAAWGIRVVHTSVVHNNEMWVMGGYYYSATNAIFLNDVWHSADGVNWYCATDSAPWEPRPSHESVVFQGKMWVLGGLLNFYWWSANDVWSSTDGINWICEDTAADWGRRYHLGGLVFDNKLWVMGGWRWYETLVNDVWYSTGLGIEEGENIETHATVRFPTIFRGPIQLPEGRNCKVFDITGRVVEPNNVTRGIYFIEVDGVVTQKVVKVR